MTGISPITNCWGQATTRRVEAEHFTVLTGREGAAYNHHAQLTSLGNRLYATWSCGYRHEDGPGQRMVVATRTTSPAAISSRMIRCGFNKLVMVYPTSGMPR